MATSREGSRRGPLEGRGRREENDIQSGAQFELPFVSIAIPPTIMHFVLCIGPFATLLVTFVTIYTLP